LVAVLRDGGDDDGRCVADEGRESGLIDVWRMRAGLSQKSFLCGFCNGYALPDLRANAVHFSDQYRSLRSIASNMFDTFLICNGHFPATRAYSGGIVRRTEQGAESQSPFVGDPVDNFRRT
jgi:hypothetical protein